MNGIVLIATALDFAARAHGPQKRKGEAQEPYINHLAEVAALVARGTGGADPELVAAALLHDAVEDAEISVADISARFGARIAGIVAEVTDDKGLQPDERKRLQVTQVSAKSDAAKMIKLADKTSNLRSILNSPPPWPHERKVAYLAWARQVIAGARGVNTRLETAFDKAAADLETVLAKVPQT